VIIQEKDWLAHIGTPRHSGRYPWGSGGDEGSTRNQTFLGMVESLKRQGVPEKTIAETMGLTVGELRAQKAYAKNERTQDDIHQARKLAAKGLSNVAIAKAMSTNGRKIGDTQVANLLKPDAEHKAKVLNTVSYTLRDAVDKKGYIDVGLGVEYHMGITRTKLDTAIQALKGEGYRLHRIPMPQLGTGQNTNMKVLTRPGTEWSDAMKNRDNISQVNDYSVDGGETMLGILPPKSISADRVGIRYAEQGGKDADGVIYVRRGPNDVSLGKNRYAQVRVMVNGTHYLKGMAVYKDDLPEGVDLLFNTNKSDTGNKLDAMKKIKDDPDNPFGATVRQIGERGPDGRMKKLTSVMNLVNQEGEWNEWSRNLPSQFLSKQKPSLAKKQLDIAYQKKLTEYEEIMRLENPVVKRKLLQAFADSADSAAVHLKAAALPKQKTQVILPVPTMKQNEVYAPGFTDGTRVALVRFPHGGTFEIPELTVNNRHPEGRKLIGPESQDAIGIHPKTAERLSGADFDGDTVLVIPNNLGLVKSAPALPGLQGFDPQAMYKGYEGMKKMTEHEKGLEMGKVSNLITDMTLRGANPDELAHAVKHSMVVIDAEKHGLDFRRSESDNGILALKKKYQTGGASTIISRAKSEKKVAERKQGYRIDPKTGEKVYQLTGRTYPDSKGNRILNTTTSTKLAEAKDARELISDANTVMEQVYADHSNRLKALGNKARLDVLATKNEKYSPSAREAYRHEVASLDAKISLAVQRAPLERQAQVIANARVRQKIAANPDLKAKTKEAKAELKRLKGQALAGARQEMGIVEKEKFLLTDKEWEAIRNRAITNNKLETILDYADNDQLKALATPRTEVKLTPTKANKAKAMLAQGYTWADISEALGVPQSTIMGELKPKEEGV
jgi:DNA-binding transcriptional ArsR family regulator